MIRNQTVPDQSHRTRAPRLARARVFLTLGAIMLCGIAYTAGRGTVARSGNAGGDPAPNADWPGYNKSYDGQRYSTLRQINTTNVARLRPVCEVVMGEGGPFQAGPVVIGNTMFVTTSMTTVAMDATTCAVRWRHVDTTSSQDPIPVNRGVAYLDGRLFRGMPGARLAAFDAQSGRVLWDLKVGNRNNGEYVSSAPIARHGMVYVGLAGGDNGIRGRVMGYDAATGREKWRFNTIPMGAERGAETWNIPASAKDGGGGTWTTYTLPESIAEDGSWG